MSPQYPECSRSAQNVPIVPRMFPQYPECSKSTQNVPKVPRMSPQYPECSHSTQNQSRPWTDSLPDDGLENVSTLSSLPLPP
ncbi:hypothetical protein M8J76_008437 [Diaphorina citri]|nr:hypothetical protein M8J76_008437 [Diaphorina citri]